MCKNCTIHGTYIVGLNSFPKILICIKFQNYRISVHWKSLQTRSEKHLNVTSVLLSLNTSLSIVRYNGQQLNQPLYATVVLSPENSLRVQIRFDTLRKGLNLLKNSKIQADSS